jgi:predicted Zn-dependent protease
MLVSFRPGLLACLAVPLACTVLAAGSFDDALQAFQRRDVTAAERTLNEMLSANPDDAAAFGLLGEVLDAEKRYPQAGAAYRRAMQLSPPSRALLDKYRNHQLMLGDIAGARATYEKALALDPGNDWAPDCW